MSRGLVQLKADDELIAPGLELEPSVPLAVEKLKEEIAEHEAIEQEDPQVAGLAGILLSRWETNRNHKSKENIQHMMIDNLRLRDSQYSPNVLTAIKDSGQSDIFMGLTNMKCRHAEAWVMDVMSSTEKPWGIQPTPNPSPVSSVKEQTLRIAQQLIEEQLEEGQEPPSPEDLELMINEEIAPLVEEELDLELNERSRKMERLIEDQLFEGDFNCAFEDFTSDLVTLKAGILKGPIVRRAVDTEWVRDEVSGEMTRINTEVVRPTFERVSPFDAYPSPGATSPDEGTFIERFYITRQELHELRGEVGYDVDAIDKALEEFPSIGDFFHDEYDEERSDLEHKDDHFVDITERVSGLEFWTPMLGKDLLEYEIKTDFKKNKIEKDVFYDVNVIMIGTNIVYIDMNTDPNHKRPYAKSVWVKKPGSFWGLGVPELMKDIQRICNASIRALVHNMSVASGPQAEVDSDRLLAGEDIESIFPFKIWQTTNKGGLTTRAVNFFQPNSNANELLAVYDRISQLADDYTGIPAFAFGNDTVAGAGRTSSGLSMLMSSAAKGIKRVILNIDREVFRPIITRQFDWNMEYIEDEAIKGDMKIVVSGAVQVMVKEQLGDRRMQLLNQTGNDIDLEIMGIEGRANMLREALAPLEMDVHKIVPPPEDIRKKAKAQERAREQESQAQAELEQAMQQLELQKGQMELQKQQAEIQNSQMKLQLEQQKLENERLKMQMESQIKSQELAIKGRSAEVQDAKGVAEMQKMGLEALSSLPEAEEEETPDDEGPVKGGGSEDEGS